MWKQQQRGQSRALQRAEAMLSSRRHRDQGPPEHSGPWGSGMTVAQKSSDLSSLSSGAGATRMRGPHQGTPNQKGPRRQEVDPHRSSPDSGALRFLKKPAAAQDQPKESAVSSVQLSQAAALSRLAQIEMRFGKSLNTKREPMVSPSTRLTEESDIRHQLSSHSSLISSPPALSSTGSAPHSPPLSPVCGNVLSLEELCSLDAASGESNSDHSAHFRVNLMDVDDLGPADLPLEEPNGGEELLWLELPEEDQVSEEEVPEEEVPEEEVPEEEVPEEEVPEEEVPEEEVPEEEVPEEEVPEEVPEEEVPEEEVPEEEVPEEVPEDIPGEDYPSDFESVVPTESVLVGSQDSEVPPSPQSASSSSSSSTSSTTVTRDRSPEHRAPVAPPRISRAHSQGDSTHTGRTHHVSAECGGSCPSLGPLMEILRQQLALTSHLISSSRQHHARLLEDLGPPNYRYITLEDMLQVSGQQNPPDTH